MEDALWPDEDKLAEALAAVLILVVMEDALWHQSGRGKEAL